MADIIPKEIDRDGVRLLARRGARIVEVLPREEYDQLHIAGAISIPLAMMSRSTADRLAWDKPVVVYSRSCLCDLSARAAWRLASMGFTQVYRYALGKADWMANGLPIEGVDARLKGAGDVAIMDAPTCKRSERMAEIHTRIQAEGWETCVVINDQEVVLGLLRSVDFEKGDPKWTAEETMERDPKTFRLNEPLESVRTYLESNPADSVVVTTTDGKFFGLIRLQDLEA